MDRAAQASRPKKRRKKTKGADAIARDGSAAIPSTSINVFRAGPSDSHHTASTRPPHERSPQVKPVPYEVRDFPALAAAPINAHQSRFFPLPTKHQSSQPPNPAIGTAVKPSDTNLELQRSSPALLTSRNIPLGSGARQPFPAPQASVSQGSGPVPIMRRPFPLDLDGTPAVKPRTPSSSSMRADSLCELRLTHLAFKVLQQQVTGPFSTVNYTRVGGVLDFSLSFKKYVGSRTCLLCREGMHDLAKCPMMMQPNLSFLRGVLAGVKQNRDNSDIDEIMFIDRLSKSIQRLEARERSGPGPIIIDSD